MADEFTCALCGGTFEKACSDDDAAGEFQAEQNMPPPAGATALVCDDCFQKIGNTAVPPEPPPGPGYWMSETSGVLQPAVEAYLNGSPMTESQIATMRAYIRQWIGSPIWDLNPHAGLKERAWLATMRAAVDGLMTRAAIAAWLDDALKNGIDPL